MEKIVLVSGPCGTGKSTLSRLLAENAPGPLAVHLHTDDFYQYIQKGYLPPWQENAGDQNEVVIAAAAACARQYALGGYEVYVDGVIGPWFLPPWKPLAEEGLDLRYIILRPQESVTVCRAMERAKREEFPLTEETVRQMWRMFAELGEYEPFAVDTGSQTPKESAARLAVQLEHGAFRLKA